MGELEPLDGDSKIEHVDAELMVKGRKILRKLIDVLSSRVVKGMAQLALSVDLKGPFSRPIHDCLFDLFQLVNSSRW